jgi:hypothetical protein
MNQEIGCVAISAAERQRKRRIEESTVSRAKRLSTDASRQQQRRTEESTASRDSRISTDASRQQQRRTEESTASRERRLSTNASRQQQRRASKSAPAPPASSLSDLRPPSDTEKANFERDPAAFVRVAYGETGLATNTQSIQEFEESLKTAANLIPEILENCVNEYNKSFHGLTPYGCASCGKFNIHSSGDGSVHLKFPVNEIEKIQAMVREHDHPCAAKGYHLHGKVALNTDYVKEGMVLLLLTKLFFFFSTFYDLLDLLF